MPRSRLPVVSEPRLNIVLVNPEIPGNTGSVGRTAAATGCRLHVVHPIGFDMGEPARRRAGLDYWHLVDCREHASWDAFVAAEGLDAPGARIWLFTAEAPGLYWDAAFAPGDFLLFGCETVGAPEHVRRWAGEHRSLSLPMVDDPGARSLNLANAVTAAVYEGLRQTYIIGP